MSETQHEALVSPTVPVVNELPICPIVKMQETSSIFSNDSVSMATSTAGPVTDSLYSVPSTHVTPVSLPKKISVTGMKVDLDSISVLSDTYSVTQQQKPVTGSLVEEQNSLLEARLLGDRYYSPYSSQNFSESPVPDSGSPRKSRRSRRQRSSQRRGSTRGEMLMEMVRHDSSKSRDCSKSSSSYPESVREKRSSSRRKPRKKSETTSSSSSSAVTPDEEGGVNGGFAGNGKRGFMSAREAVEQGDMICGCILKDKFLYFRKPLVHLLFGCILISGGLALTVLHFVYEDSLTQVNAPYFTYGPITLSTGVILFMVGLVWLPIKQQKWKDGTASPMLAALARLRIEQEKLELNSVGALVSNTIDINPRQATSITNESEV